MLECLAASSVVCLDDLLMFANMSRKRKGEEEREERERAGRGRRERIYF